MSNRMAWLAVCFGWIPALWIIGWVSDHASIGDTIGFGLIGVFAAGLIVTLLAEFGDNWPLWLPLVSLLAVGVIGVRVGW